MSEDRLDEDSTESTGSRLFGVFILLPTLVAIVYFSIVFVIAARDNIRQRTTAGKEPAMVEFTDNKWVDASACYQIFKGPGIPSNAKPGDIWINTHGLIFERQGDVWVNLVKEKR